MYDTAIAKGKFFVLDHEFNIPELERTRKIWMYLPPDYDTSDKPYPVIYGQDGQNLFDDYASYAGEWHLDETLDRLFQAGDWGAIVVGIENSRDGETRVDEYSPWRNEKYDLGGSAHLYLNFLIDVVKPYIDENFRTIPEREYTIIAGSSMGGLISLYAALERPDVFGRAAVFSPSMWFVPQAFQYISDTGRKQSTKFFLLAGEKEGSRTVELVRWVHDTMAYAGFPKEELYLDIHADGEHNEWFWGREFGKAYRWLLGKG